MYPLWKSSGYLLGSPAVLLLIPKIVVQDIPQSFDSIKDVDKSQVKRRHAKTQNVRCPEIPNDIAIELSKLDRGEVSTTLTRNGGDTLVFLMMCGRTEVANAEADRAEVARALRASRLNAVAESLLAQLRANARITYQ